MRLLIPYLFLSLLPGCTSYARMIDGLNARQINSCVEANISVSTGLAMTGTAHMYTATGGQDVATCIREFENRPNAFVEAETTDTLRRLEERVRPSAPVGMTAQERQQWIDFLQDIIRALLPSRVPAEVPASVGTVP